ncbi:cytochrome c [Marinobacter salicampi]|uniref:cytochrome c n=1 Tax=Marinobacter salicampi TaxID=435907 RepID=UPI00140C5738|nr:cytochrome c [Marinobacter salicampi]
MKARTEKLLATVLLGLTVSTSSMAAEPVTPKLTDKLSQLLQKEMRAVQGGMASIHSAMVMGQHESVAENAQQIHDSFILQQELTEQDRKDLMSAVPKGFIKLDKEFHKLAAALAEAGVNENTKKQRHLYDEMTRTCIECHGKYVSDRFPAVNPGKN